MSTNPLNLCCCLCIVSRKMNEGPQYRQKHTGKRKYAANTRLEQIAKLDAETKAAIAACKIAAAQAFKEGKDFIINFLF